MLEKPPLECLDSLTSLILETLSDELPRVSGNWWQTRVVDQLTFQQQQHVRTSNIAELRRLDLAALLRVLDQNWFDLAEKRSWPRSARNWLKEAQTIRNRWAHAPASGLDDSDVYRDLDTIERLMALLGADVDALKSLKTIKLSLIASLSGQLESAKSPASIQPLPASAFGKGTLVHLKARPAVTGAVIDHLPGDPEDRYMVFHDGSVATYYASQIELTVAKPGRVEVTLDALHAG